jgi:uncharacterized protein YbcI
MQSKEEIEHQVSNAIISFEKEYMGRGPVETQSFVIDNMVIVRLKGVLTQAEMQLVKTRDKERGRNLIKEVRIELLEQGRPLLEAVIESITQLKMVSLHTDISTRTGERLIVFSMSDRIIK